MKSEDLALWVTIGGKVYPVSKRANGNQITPAVAIVAGQPLTVEAIRQQAADLSRLADICSQLDGMLIYPADFKTEIYQDEAGYVAMRKRK